MTYGAAFALNLFLCALCGGVRGLWLARGRRPRVQGVAVLRSSCWHMAVCCVSWLIGSILLHMVLT